MLLQSQLPHGGSVADLLLGIGCSPVLRCLHNSHSCTVLSNISDLIPSLVGEVSNYPLRNANDFTTPRTRTETFRKSCIPSSVALWNSLDSSVRDIDSFKRFKNTLKTSLFPKIPTSLSKGNRYLSVNHCRIRNGC